MRERPSPEPSLLRPGMQKMVQLTAGLTPGKKGPALTHLQPQQAGEKCPAYPHPDFATTSCILSDSKRSSMCRHRNSHDQSDSLRSSMCCSLPKPIATSCILSDGYARPCTDIATPTTSWTACACSCAATPTAIFAQFHPLAILPYSSISLTPTSKQVFGVEVCREHSDGVA